MKKVFFEQYPMTEKDIRVFLQKGLLVFDTNVLLNLYFYTSETKNKMFGVMEKCKDRLWLPYQVGWEYFNNRKDKIDKLRNSCDVISNHVNNAKNSFSGLLNDNYQRHPYIVRNELIDLFNNGLKPLEEKLKELKKKDPGYAKKDTIWAKLEKLYEGKTGGDYPLEKLEAIYKEGEERYNLKIPPGYADIKDKKGKGPRHLYGDVIIWKMVIDHAKENKVDVVFVTEEKKEDWFEKKREPRKDLLKEFFDKSEGQKILICGQEEFLYLADRHLGTAVGEEAIKEIKEVANEERKLKELQMKLAESRSFIEEWRKRTDPSIVSSSVIDGGIMDPGLTLDAYSSLAKWPWRPISSYFGESGVNMPSLSSLHEPVSGSINPNITLADYFLQKTPEVGSLEIPDMSAFFGEQIQPTGLNLGDNKTDEARNDDTGDTPNIEGKSSKKKTKIR